ncbi:MAG: hypothetical protein KF871_03965 [Hydrogenophaga sp.]|uniref:hypothetical protein n=1 Tax=Hydrogenophaga sp. TaxID=1904254 RepID=UPI001D50D178|nr:hypothetical protein [Hydrogenophaga sp.]MBX3609029.1 hypothetical protein [Hydrogenophaga sp.]
MIADPVAPPLELRIQPRHAPLGGIGLPKDATAQELALHAAMRHFNGLTAPTKSALYGGWSAAMFTRLGGMDPHIGGFLAFGSAVAITVSSLFHMYATQVDKNKSKADYLLAFRLVCQQEQLLAQLRSDATAAGTEPDAELTALASANIKALQGFVGAFETAFYPPAQRPLMAQAREGLRSYAEEIVKLQVEIDALGDAPGHQEAAQALRSRVKDLEGYMDEGISRKQVKVRLEQKALDAQHALQKAQSTEGISEEALDAAQQHFDQCKANVRAFEPKVLERIANPFTDEMGKALKWDRDVALLAPWTAVGMASGATALATTLEVANLAATSLGLGVVSSALTLYISGVDIKDAKGELAAASAAKIRAIDLGAHAGALRQALREHHAPEVQRCQYLAGAQQKAMARAQRLQHGATNQAQVRMGKGSAGLVNAGVGTVLGIAAAVTVTGAIAAPAAVVGATLFGGFLATVAARVAKNKFAFKDPVKARQAAGLAFVQSFGAEGIEALYDALANGKADAWAQKLADLRTKLNKEGGQAAAVARYLTLDKLKDNEFLAAEHLGRALLYRQQHPGTSVYQTEAQVAKALAAQAGKPDPNLLKTTGFASLGEYHQRLRTDLVGIYGGKYYDEDRLQYVDGKDVMQTALQVTTALDQTIPQNDHHRWHTLTTVLRSAIRQDSSLIESISAEDWQALREVLNDLRGTLGASGIGSAELYALQAAVVAEGDGQVRLDPNSRDGLLAPQVAPYLLELLAEPAWLGPPAAQAATSMNQTDLDAAAKGAKALAALNAGIKAEGAKWGKRTQSPADDAPAPGSRPRSKSLVRQLSESGATFLRTKSRAAVNHVVKRSPNTLATPERALAWLNRQTDGRQRANGLIGMLREFIARLPDPKPTTQKALREQLQAARHSANAALDGLKQQGEPVDSKSLRRQADRLESSIKLCDTLDREVTSDEWDICRYVLPAQPQ